MPFHEQSERDSSFFSLVDQLSINSALDCQPECRNLNTNGINIQTASNPHQKRASESLKRINPDFKKPVIAGSGEGASINLGLGGGYTINHSKAASNLSGVNELVEGQNFILSSTNRMFEV